VAPGALRIVSENEIEESLASMVGAIIAAVVEELLITPSSVEKLATPPEAVLALGSRLILALS
jgi:hypothetical protein